LTTAYSAVGREARRLQELHVGAIGREGCWAKGGDDVARRRGRRPRK